MPRRGGYIVGKREYVDKIAGRLTAPSIGAEVGSYAYGYQYFYEGVFLAPHVVCQALKGGLLIGACLEKLGFESSPSVKSLPYDITRAIRFNTREELIAFIQAVQEASPGRQFCNARALGYAGLSGAGDHGCRHVCAGRFDRTFCRCSR